MKYFDETPDIQLMGMAGKARSGKDYLSQHYLIEPHDFIPLSLANWFKEEAVRIEGFDYDEIYEEKTPESRNYMQQRGTENGRMKYGEDVWCDIVELRMKYFVDHGLRKFVITDVRFRNEIEWIHELGGSVFYIFGRGGAETDEAKNHQSERELDQIDPDVFDAIVYNSSDVEDQVDRDMKRYLRKVGINKTSTAV